MYTTYYILINALNYLCSSFFPFLHSGTVSALQTYDKHACKYKKPTNGERCYRAPDGKVDNAGRAQSFDPLDYSNESRNVRLQQSVHLTIHVVI